MKGLEDYLIKALGLYESLPDWFQKLVAKVYLLLPESYRLGNQVKEFEQLIQSTEKLSKEELYQLQNKEFLKTIDYAKKTDFYPRFYKENGIEIDSIKSLDQITSLPFITKEIIQKNMDAMKVKGSDSRGIYATTGGSSGLPSGFYLEKGVSRAKELAFIENIWGALGYERGDKCAILRGKITSKTKENQLFKKDHIRNWLYLSSYHLTKDQIREYIKHLKEFKPKYIQGYPSSLYLFCKLLAEENIKLNIPLKGIFVGSENLSERQKNLIEETFKAQVITWYGHAEVIVLGGYCKLTSKYHLFPQYGYPEIVNEDGQPIHEGVGEIVGTNFHNSVFPLIRFKTKDFAKVSKDEKCNCNRNYLMIDSIEGRKHEFIIVDNGRKVSLTSINMHDSTFKNIKQYQFIQEVENQLIVRCSLIDTTTSINEDSIKKSLSIKLGESCEITIEVVDEISLSKRGKVISLIQKLDFV